MNIIQAKFLNDLVGKNYTYKITGTRRIRKDTLLLVENKKTGKPNIVISTTDSEDVSENVLNMIMQGKEVCSKVLGEYLYFEHRTVTEAE